jgi:cytochrome c556
VRPKQEEPVSLSNRSLVSIVVGSLALGGGLGVALAADPAQERHLAMEQVNDAAQPLFAIAKKEAPFDAAVVGKNAGTILEKLKQAQGLFPAGSSGGKSRAKPEIWNDAAGFDKAMKDAQAAVTKLAAAKDEAAFAAAIGALGASCKGCHEKYRLPKQ